MIRNEDGTYTSFLGDNDGGWACHYLNALCFEFAVTADPEVRAEAINIFRPSINEAPVPASYTIYSVGDHDQTTERLYGKADESHGRRAAFKSKIIPTTRSSRKYTSFMFHRFVAEGRKRSGRRARTTVTDHIVDDGSAPRGLHRKFHGFGPLGPDFVYSPFGRDELGSKFPPHSA